MTRHGQAPELTRLVQDAKAGKTEAIEQLIDLYGRRLYGLLYRLSSSTADAEELLQETFVKMLRGLQAYREDGRFEAWLFSIAANTARDALQRQQRAPATVSFDAEHNSRSAVASDEAAPEKMAARAEAADLLQQALQELSAAEREVVSLRFFSSLAFKDIAEILGVPLGTALARAHRGLRHLRDKLERYDL